MSRWLVFGAALVIARERGAAFDDGPILESFALE